MSEKPLNIKSSDTGQKNNGYPSSIDKTYLSDMVANKDLDKLKKFNNTKGLLSFLRVDNKVGLRTTSVEDATGNNWSSTQDSSNESQPQAVKTPKNTPKNKNQEDLSWIEDLETTKLTFPDRVKAFGINVYPSSEAKTFFRYALDVLNDKMLILLCFAAVVSLALGIYQDVRVTGISEEDDNDVHWIEGFSIIIAIAVVVLVSASNDYKKDKQFKKLNEKKKDRYIKVIRDGIQKELSVNCVMVGDIMVVESGEVLCADAVLISSSNLKVDESSITGESDARHKYSVEEHQIKNSEAKAKWLEFKSRKSKFDASLKPNSNNSPKNSSDEKTENEAAITFNQSTLAIPPDDLISSDPFLISGSLVLEGIGECVVVSVGENAFYGRTLMSLTEGNEATPLQIKLNDLAELIAKVGGAIAIIMLIVLVIQYVILIARKKVVTTSTSIISNLVNIFISVITIIVVAIPEGLPLAVTLSLAIATVRMLKDNCMVRILAACETMGNATTICSDKTGTLTQNKMTVITGTIGIDHGFRLYPIGTANIMKRKATISPNDDLVTNADGNLVYRSKSSSNNLSVNIDDKPVLPNSFGATGDPGDLIIGPVPVSNDLTSEIERRETELSKFRQVTPKGVIDLVFDSIALNSTAFVIEKSLETPDILDFSKKKGFLSSLFSKVKNTKKSDNNELNSQSSNVNDSLNHNIDDFNGSSTETALLQWAQRIGETLILKRRSDKSDLIKEIWPFSSAKKFMSVLVNAGKNSGKIVYRLYVKGAPETMLSECTRYLDVNDCDESTENEKNPGLYKEYPTLPLTIEASKSIMNTISDYSARALRTIGLLYCDVTEDDLKRIETEECENIWHFKNNLVWVGVFGIEDPLRDGVTASVRKCQSAGIMVRMVTGDNLITARAIATQCGIYTPGMGGIVMEGKHFRNLYPEEMEVIIPRLQVLARSSPTDKQILVNWLKDHGNVVAVTGDGTNDGPALRAADVGFSMGISGTEIAKEASDIILVDDNFNSILKALLWGRCVNDSMKKFLQFQLTVNVTAVTVAFVSAVQGNSQDPVFSPVQLLWVNLIMDTFAALALATDPPQESLLNRFPERPNAPIITLSMWKNIIGQSIVQIAVNFYTLYGSYSVFGLDYENPTEYLVLRSIVFNVFVFLQIFNEFNCRVLGSEVNPFKGITKNKYFLMVVVGTIIAQILLIEFGNNVFQTKSLSALQWLYCVGIGLLSLPVGLALRLFPTKILEKIIPFSNKPTYKDPEDLDWQPPAQTVQRQLAFLNTLRGGRLASYNLLGMKVRYDKINRYTEKESKTINGMSHAEILKKQREAVERVISELPNDYSKVSKSKNKSKYLEALSRYKPTNELLSIAKNEKSLEPTDEQLDNEESKQFKMSKLSSKFNWAKKSKRNEAGFSFAAAMVPTMVGSSIGAGMIASTKPQGDEISKIISQTLDEKESRSKEGSPADQK
ncbi:Calcium-transporting ATPase PAT1 [Smittium culicis]|uniref:Calcium-transporting ATPase n=1 Tax=Smittium culicis TaxID=133412 RepID=A0A1R1YI02_9FUNG|nr:Calcium-transporting ATPase PAT1 [Smittium culicis]